VSTRKFTTSVQEKSRDLRVGPIDVFGNAEDAFRRADALDRVLFLPRHQASDGLSVAGDDDLVLLSAFKLGEELGKIRLCLEYIYLTHFRASVNRLS
jgi:hypothetical protein